MPQSSRGGSDAENKGSPGDTVSVNIPKLVAQRVEKRLASSGFKSVDEYVSHVLDAVLKELEGEQAAETRPAATPFSKEDQESVEQRLRALGYM